MPLSCSCDWDEPEFGQWMIDYFNSGVEMDFKPFEGKRRVRCASCKELINVGSLCIEYPRSRYPRNEIEAKILGKDPDGEDWEEPWIKMPSLWHCEKCGEIYLNLFEGLRFECLLPNENMEEMLQEYTGLYDPPPLKGESKKTENRTLKKRETKRFVNR